MNGEPLPDHYGVIGVAPDASPRQIRRAYLTAAKLWHPDAHRGDREFATRRMQDITGAYAVLSDPDRRAVYDDRRTLEAELHEEREAEAREAEAREAVRVREAAAARKAAQDREAQEHAAEERAAEERAARARDASRALDEEFDEALDERTAQQIRERWRATAPLLNDHQDPDAFIRLVAELFGPHLTRAMVSTGPLGDVFHELMREAMAAARATRRAAIHTRQAARSAAAAASAPTPGVVAPDADRDGLTFDADAGSPWVSTPSNFGPPAPRRPLSRPRRSPVAVLVGGATALALAGYAVVGSRPSDSDRIAREALDARPPAAGVPATTTGGSAERELLVSELRRLDAAMERVRRRSGRWPLTPPIGLVAASGVRLQVGLARAGWVGKATSVASGRACRLDVTSLPSGRAQRTLECTASMRPLPAPTSRPRTR